MELTQAVESVRKLAKGVNPVTGEAFQKDSIYNQPEITRSLFEVLNHLPKRRKSLGERQQENIMRGYPKNTGMPWEDEARKLVATAYKSGKSLEEIASSHERSKIAIVAELKQQGILSAEEAARFGFVKRQ